MDIFIVVTSDNCTGDRVYMHTEQLVTIWEEIKILKSPDILSKISLKYFLYQL